MADRAKTPDWPGRSIGFRISFQHMTIEHKSRRATRRRVAAGEDRSPTKRLIRGARTSSRPTNRAVRFSREEKNLRRPDCLCCGSRVRAPGHAVALHMSGQDDQAVTQLTIAIDAGYLPSHELLLLRKYFTGEFGTLLEEKLAQRRAQKAGDQPQPKAPPASPCPAPGERPKQ